MTYNITMSELPFTCPACNKENMVDMENLDGKPVNKIVTELGFMCECGTWVRLSYTTRSLDDALIKLEKKSPGSAGYHYHFAKALRKAEGVQEKYGSF
jgi:C4-type Zn-finger protein